MIQRLMLKLVEVFAPQAFELKDGVGEVPISCLSKIFKEVSGIYKMQQLDY